LLSAPASTTGHADSAATGSSHTRVAAIVPCHNEAASVGAVVRGLREAVPGIEVYVYDNASSDHTAEIARRAGAIVRHEPRKGKGNVVRRAFADIDADIYVLIDGDDTYDAGRVGDLVNILREGPYDQITGLRRQVTETAFRRGHATGNRLFNTLVSTIFKARVSDMLSGYRVFSRRFVKSFPAGSRGFEIEAELTVHAMNLRMPQAEVPIDFKDRPEGGESKLRTYHDGFRILWLIMELARYERPVLYHGIVAMVLSLTGLLLGIPVVAQFASTGMVPRLPTAVLASSLMILALLVLMTGFVLDGIRRSRQELIRLCYLALPGTNLTDRRP
jgi:glycosyltransferase involved in cell wall biosynthesis